MKKGTFITAVLIIGMIACLASCKKKQVEPTPEPEPEPTPYVWNHTQHALTHVDAVTPTATKNGNIEYYICDSCAMKFADAEGKEPIDQVILWATDYGFDYNNVLDFYEQFDGDEPYFDKIAYGTIHVEGCESSLYPDYSGWASWTNDQWIDYITAVNSYYEEIGGGPDLFGTTGGDDFDVTKIAEFMLSIVVKHGVPLIDPQLKRFVNPNGYLQDQIKIVLDKLGDIQKGIADIKDQIKINEYKRAIEQRGEKISFLTNGTDPYFRQIIDKVGNKNFSELSQEQLAGIDSVLRIWYGDPSAINSPVTLTLNLLESVNNRFTTDSTTYPGIYDYYAYHTIPWEHEGYAFRESLRAADALSVSEAYMMCILYFKRFGGPSVWSKTQERLNSFMMSYANTLNDHKIVYNRDIRICQIPGAQMKLKKQMHVLDAYTWMRNHPDYNYLVPDFPKQMAYFRNAITDGKGMVSKEVIFTIYQYYKQKGVSGGIYEYLRKAKFQGLDNDEILVGGETKWDPKWVSMYYVYEFKIRSWPLFITNKDHFGYRTALHDNCVIRHANILDNCNISGGIITKWGQKSSYVFCNLEAIGSKDGE